jgi:phosphoribosylamine--glycine ligase
MNVLVLGSGGREHALAWKMASSKHLSKLFVAPGNPGTFGFANNVNIGVNDFVALADFALKNNIECIVVGPENPLVEGIVDFFAEGEHTKNILVVGPNKESAQLEGSKDFAKDFMLRHKIPTARYKSFSKSTMQAACDFLDTLQAPYVLKADGLAGGKGVLILTDLDHAKDALKQMVDGKFGNASEIVVIEEFLDGIEMSYFVFTDGTDYVILPEAKDYKRIGEKDTGLNTGGMGAVSPVPFADSEMLAKIEDRIVKPTIAGLKKDQMKYFGFIFIGLMIVDNEPFVIEYNVRLGDPETEVILPRMNSDLLEMFLLAKTNKLNEYKISISSDTAVTVMIVSGGYPEDYQIGRPISVPAVSDALLFHAGTKFCENNIVSNGGRVLAVSAMADNMQKALAISYQNIGKMHFDEMYFRRDIGFDLST